jgi:hypothetical protein
MARDWVAGRVAYDVARAEGIDPARKRPTSCQAQSLTALSVDRAGETGQILREQDGIAAIDAIGSTWLVD